MRVTRHISQLFRRVSLQCLVTGIVMLAGLAAYGQNDPDSIKSRELGELTVTTRRPGMSRVAGA